MKDTEFKMFLHQRLCDLADGILYYYKPCQRDGDDCISGRVWCCTATRFKTNIFEKFDDRPNCFFLGNDGCTFPNIECKVWLCSEAKQSSPECSESLELVGQIALLHELF